MPDIHIRKQGKAGCITLQRPQALNALSPDMASQIEQALIAWDSDDDVALILIDAEGDRAFCAGGDIVAMYKWAKDDRSDDVLTFWRDEYRLNNMIANYSKPYVAFMDGIVMGGGVGISSHGSHRIVTERTMCAMPECAIGLLPDVGGTYLLSQTAGFSGEYLGLTGQRMNASDAIYAGFADFYCASERLSELHEALINTGSVEVIADFTSQPEPSGLEQNRAQIDAIFGADSLAEIIERLGDDGSEFCADTMKKMAHGAPHSLLMTLSLVRSARQTGSLSHALVKEFRGTSTALLKGEFLEGVRAAVIDKDRKPQWAYRRISEVPNELVEALLLPAYGGDAEL